MGNSTNIVVGGASIIHDSTDLGYIVDGVTLIVESDMWYGAVEGIPADIVARRTKSSYKFATTLVEPTMANLKIAYDWQNTESGDDPIALDFGGENFVPSTASVEIYGYVPGGDLFTRKITLDSAVAESGGELKNTDADMVKIPVTFKGLYNETNSRVGELSDAAS